MEALKLPDVFHVQRPRLTAIGKTRELDCLDHFDFYRELDIPMIHNLGAQATEGLASFTDMSRNLFVEGSMKYLK